MVTHVGQKEFLAYLRVSTDKQAGDGRSSLETQEQRIRAFAIETGGVVVRLFCDVDSGRRDDRPEYRKMLDYAAAHDIDAVLVQYLDRFGRNPKEILSRIWQLRDRGIKVITTDQDITDEMMLLVNAGMAGHESKRTSERVRANMSTSAKKGVHSGPPPFGLKPEMEIRDGKAVVTRWTVVDKEAATIREMTRLSVEDNLGFKAIADTLNARGITTRQGRYWVPASIQLILRNPAIKGTLVFGRNSKDESLKKDPVEVPGAFPAILTDEEWDELQQRLDIRRGAPRGSVHRSQYLLSGLLRCGHCNGPMTGKSGSRRKDGSLYRSYLCVSAKKTRAACSYPNNHRAEKLEQAVLDYLGQFSDPRQVAKLLKGSGEASSKRLEQDLARSEKKLADLDRDFHQNLELLKKGVLNEDEFSSANAKRRDQRTALETRLADLRTELEQKQDAEEAASTLPLKVRSFAESFEALDTPKSKAILQTILARVFVWKGGKIELEFRQR